LQELELDKAKYTIFPLRVSGNHWGLFILTKDIFDRDEVYYTSSLNTESEATEIRPLISQIVGEKAAENIQIINPTDKQKNINDCGVYLVFYILELLETGKLELTKTYTSQEIQNFRQE
jgi:Ulp1 family protease